MDDFLIRTPFDVLNASARSKTWLWMTANGRLTDVLATGDE